MIQCEKEYPGCSNEFCEIARLTTAEGQGLLLLPCKMLPSIRDVNVCTPHAFLLPFLDFLIHAYTSFMVHAHPLITHA
eukprot:1141983-Pelagomonas_calceolata.AAC.3